MDPSIFTKSLHHNSKPFIPKYSPLILLGILLVLSFVYHLDDIALMRPQGIHQWRQCDCLSLTNTIYQGEAKFFETKIMNLLNDNEGRTVSEFPLVYYLVAKLWQVFGPHEWIFRLFNLAISFLAMLAMLRIFEQKTKDSFWSIFSVLILFTSGIYVYYSFNFLMNTTAFSISLIAWYCFFRYSRDKHIRTLLFALLLFLIAGLLKMSSLMNLGALIALFALEWLDRKRFSPQGRIFANRGIFVIGSFFVLLTIFLWLRYVTHYNSTWNSGVFLVGILPIWEMTQDEIAQVLDYINVRWKDGYYFFPTQIVFFAALILIFLKGWRKNRTLFLITLMLTIAFALFIILFFSPLNNHDYYVIDLLMLSVFIMLSFFSIVKITKPEGSPFINRTFLKVIAIVFLVFNVVNTEEQIRWRYRHFKPDKEEFRGYFEIEEHLESLGINKSKKVLVPTDRTINISLYLMNRRGWTRYGTNMNDSTAIARRIEMGAEYMLYHKPIDMEQNTYWKSFIKDNLGSFEGVEIYSLNVPEVK